MTSIQPFDITAASQEIKNIDTELARLRGLSNNLKKKKKEIEDKMGQFLTKHNQKGVIINDITIMNETQTKNKTVPKKEKEAKMKELFSHYVDLPEKLMYELGQVTKGQQVVQNKIKINYEKSK